MTDKQVEEHLKKVMEHATEMVANTSEEQWQNYKKLIVENNGSPIPQELESNIRAVFNYAYGQGLCMGIEDTIIRYNAQLNLVGGGEA